MADRKKIAAIVTSYYPDSHADVIVTRFLKGFSTDNGHLDPKVDLIAIYVDQISHRDMGLALCKKYGVPVFSSILSTLTLGGKELAVDGVLIIGEHGDYAWNEKQQHLYPRKYFFEQVCGVFSTSGRSVPVFIDKHLSYNWQDAKWIYDRAQELEVPLMAGSSLPLAWRSPWIEYNLETPVDEALSVAYGGLDSYGFHGLEALQCMVERRKGGETGIVSVTTLEGESVWRSKTDGIWWGELIDGLCALVTRKEKGDMEEFCKNPVVFLMEYVDGLRTATLVLNGYMKGWGYVGRVNDRVEAMEIFLPNDSHGHFSYLGLNIQEMFLTGNPQYPVERTLLISGALEALMESRYRGNMPVETPHLNVSYKSYEKLPIRPESPNPSGVYLIPCRK